MHSVLVYKWQLLPMVWCMATSAKTWVGTSLVVWLKAISACGLINGNFCLWFDYGAFSLQVVWLWGILLSVAWLMVCFPYSWFDIVLYPNIKLIHLQWYYFQWRLLSVCTAMSFNLLSYLSSLVCQFHLLYTVIRSYKFHAYIHTFIHIHIHAYNIHAHLTCIQISFIHKLHYHPVSYFNGISLKVSSLVWLIQRCHQSTIFQMARSSLNKFGNPFYLASSVFQTTCSPSNSLKIQKYVSTVGPKLAGSTKKK